MHKYNVFEIFGCDGEKQYKNFVALSCSGKCYFTWCLGRPTMDGKTALGASSPAKPALHMPEPLSTTKAATSSSHILFCWQLKDKMKWDLTVCESNDVWGESQNFTYPNRFSYRQFSTSYRHRYPMYHAYILALVLSSYFGSYVVLHVFIERWFCRTPNDDFLECINLLGIATT